MRSYIENRELGQNGIQFLVERVLREFDFSHVEASNTIDFEVCVDNLAFGENCELPVSKMVDRKLAVGVLRCVFDRTMSRKSAAVGTGAMLFKPFVVDMAGNDEYEREVFGRKERPAESQSTTEKLWMN